MLRLKKEHLKKIDIWMILLMTALIGIGTLAIDSATSYSGDTTIVNKQIMFFVIGFVLMLIVMSIDYHWLGEWYLGIYGITLAVLISVFFLGVNVNGAARWIEVAGIQIQPSEFAKIAMIICTAKLIDKYNDKINSVVSVGIIGLFQFVPFILINRQPNLSTSIVIVLILVVQLFMSELDLKYIFSTAVIALLAVVLILGYIIKNPNQKLIADYQRDRIVTKVEGGDSLGDHYQTSRSVHAIGSGGLKGKGLYQGAISQLNYLPESHNDFIVAIIAEEFGFVGIVSMLGIILLLITRGLWIAHSAPDNYGRLIVGGYMGMIAIQSFVNMGVVTNLLPNTGLPLPFISYGGSSLWANMMGMGLVLNVAMRREETMF
ncbi:MAG: FtsW/RodA/SpoVE family cell cycle protein [Cellulosilyticaceae bacterium]